MSERSERVDLVVVGGGAMGLATAWAAASRGRVVLVERFDPGHHRGASHGGERIFRHAYADVAYVDLALAAEEGWHALERAAGRPLLQRVGCVEHGAEADLDALAAGAGARGVATERLTASEASRRWPALAFATDVLAQPGAGWVRAADGLAVLAAEAAGAGADLRFGQGPVTVEPAGDGVRVATASGRAVVAPVGVVTAGAWTTDVLASFDLALPPLVTTQENVFFLDRRPGAAFPAFIQWEGRDRYGTPSADGRVKVGEHHTGTVTTGDTRSGVADAARIGPIEDYARAWLPGAVPRVVATTTCLYTSTPTLDFVLDRAGPIVVGAGFSGHGFKFVPEVGRRLTALALDGARSVPPFTFAAHAAAAAGG